MSIQEQIEFVTELKEYAEGRSSWVHTAGALGEVAESLKRLKQLITIPPDDGKWIKERDTQVL